MQATLLRPEQVVWEGGEGQVELEFIVPPHGVVGVFSGETPDL